ncbi:MAG: prepilin-type N-terminal cleavage/methylation domain-containing protein [Bacilli bacterium]|nr:prepilin-type N-terminal cleavage/methylation domain-containing protein [Bacilli bacterium]
MKKGFTLIELLAVIVILGLIALITVPIVLDSLNSTKSELSKEQVRQIEAAARIWGTKNLNDDSIEKSITIRFLIDNNLLEDKDYKNIDLNSSSFENAGVCIYYNNNQFVYTYKKNVGEC